MARKPLDVKLLDQLLTPTVRDLVNQYAKSLLADGGPIKANVNNTSEITDCLARGYRLDDTAMVWRHPTQSAIRNAISTFYMDISDESPKCETEEEWTRLHAREAATWEILRQYEKSL